MARTRAAEMGGERVGRRAITTAHVADEMHNSSWGYIPWIEYCFKDLGRLLKKGDSKARFGAGHGFVWLTRDPPVIRDASDTVDSEWGSISWEDYCKRECARHHAYGIRSARIINRDGVMWLSPS